MMLPLACARRAGFTLIEIMIVIAIIAILAGIVVPNFVEARAEANYQACKKNCQTIGLAVATYLVRHSDDTLLNLMGYDGGDKNGIRSSLTRLIENVPDFQGCGFENLRCPAKYGTGIGTEYSLAYGSILLENGGEHNNDAWFVTHGTAAGTSKTNLSERGAHYVGGIYMKPVYMVGSGAFDLMIYDPSTDV